MIANDGKVNLRGNAGRQNTIRHCNAEVNII